MLGVVQIPSHSQEAKPSPTPPPMSSVQFINATSVPNIKLAIKDFHEYPKLAQGAKISGGHFNPAVTAWALATGKIGKAKALSYTIAQIGAAVFIWVMSSLVKV